jgi:hypothetical protein
MIKRAAATAVPAAATPGAMTVAGKRAAVMLLVMIAWVFFRATTVAGAMSIIRSMFFMQRGMRLEGLDFQVYFWILLAAALALFAPSTQQLTRYTAKLTEPLRLPQGLLLGSLRSGNLGFSASPAVALGCGALFAAALTTIWRPAIFIYFNF